MLVRVQYDLFSPGKLVGVYDSTRHFLEWDGSLVKHVARGTTVTECQYALTEEGWKALIEELKRKEKAGMVKNLFISRRDPKTGEWVRI